jgi:hypothetical protein
MQDYALRVGEELVIQGHISGAGARRSCEPSASFRK